MKKQLQRKKGARQPYVPTYSNATIDEVLSQRRVASPQRPSLFKPVVPEVDKPVVVPVNEVRERQRMYWQQLLATIVAAADNEALMALRSADNNTPLDILVGVELAARHDLGEALPSSAKDLHYVLKQYDETPELDTLARSQLLERLQQVLQPLRERLAAAADVTMTQTWMHHAAKCGDLALFDLLLVLGLPVTVYDEQGMLPLHWAAKFDHVDIVNRLVTDYGQSLFSCYTSEKYQHLLVVNGWYFACTAQTQKLVEATLPGELAKSQRCLPRDKYHRNLFHYAAMAGNITVMQQLYQAFPARSNRFAIDAFGATVLHYSAASGVVQAFDYAYTTMQIDISKRDSEKCTVIHYAARSKNPAMIARLRQLNVKCDVLDKYQRNASHHAAGFTTPAVFLALIEDEDGQPRLGFALSTKDAFGCTPVHYAFAQGNTPIARLIIEDKNNVALLEDVHTGHGLDSAVTAPSPCHLAALSGHAETFWFGVRALQNFRLKNPIKLNLWGSLLDVEGRTLLDCAFQSAQPQLIHDVAVEHINEITANMQDIILPKEELTYLFTHYMPLTDLRRLAQVNRLFYSCVNSALEKIYGADRIKPILERCQQGSYFTPYAFIPDTDVAATNEHFSLLHRDLTSVPTPALQQSLLHKVAQAGDYDFFRWLVEKGGYSVKQHDENGLLPIHYAAQQIGYVSPDDGNEAHPVALIDDFQQPLDEEDDALGALAALPGEAPRPAPAFAAEHLGAGHKVGEPRYCPERIVDYCLHVHKQSLFSDFTSEQYRQADTVNAFYFLCRASKNNEGDAPVSVYLQRLFDKMKRFSLAERIRENRRDKMGRSALHYAIWAGLPLDTIEVMLECGYDIYATDKNNMGCYHFAAMSGSADLVQLCEQNELPARNADLAGQTPSNLLGIGGDWDSAAYFVTQHRGSLAEKDALYRNAYFRALERGHLTFIQEVETHYSHWVDFKEVWRDREGSSALLYAARSGSVPLLRYLIEDKELPLNAADSSGRGVLQYAAWRGDIDAWKYLYQTLEQKAPNAALRLNRDDDQNNTLHYACMSGKLPLMLHIAACYPESIGLTNSKNQSASDLIVEDGTHHYFRTVVFLRQWKSCVKASLAQLVAQPDDYHAYVDDLQQELYANIGESHPYYVLLTYFKALLSQKECIHLDKRVVSRHIPIINKVYDALYEHWNASLTQSQHFTLAECDSLIVLLERCQAELTYALLETRKFSSTFQEKTNNRFHKSIGGVIPGLFIALEGLAQRYTLGKLVTPTLPDPQLGKN